MAKGIGRKELREPDEFLTLTNQALDYAKHHERELAYAAGALALVIALALGVRWYRGWQDEKAESAFGAARRDFAEQRFDTAVKGFERVSTDWRGTRFGTLALVYEGNSYAELGKTKEAEGAFRAVLDASREPLLQQIAHYNLGLLAAKAGDGKTAATELGAAAAIEGPLRGPAWFSRLASHEKFVENVKDGMMAIDELNPSARAFVEAQLGPRAKDATPDAQAATGSGSVKVE
jgi:hypothetical protein